MGYLRARLTDGSEVEFADEPRGRGAMKLCFFSRDRQRVVLFYRRGEKDRVTRRRRLDRILKDYNPTHTHSEFWRRHYCWPTAILDNDPSVPPAFLDANGLLKPALAVVCPAYTSNYFFESSSGRRLDKKGRWFSSLKLRRTLPPDEQGDLRKYLVLSSKMARAVRRLHQAGLAHSDLSHNNVLMDPKGGEACIIDIDSLVVPDVAPPDVMGTDGYIAPEVLAQTARPSIATDRHALAVLIYETLLGRHPLRGSKFHSKSVDEDEYFMMGPRALFVEHPSDRSNWLKPPPPVAYSRLGPHLAPLIEKSFILGLHHAEKRPDARDWERALYLTIDLLHPSPQGTNWTILGPGAAAPQCLWSNVPFRQQIPYGIYFRTDATQRRLYDRHALVAYHHLQLFPWHLRQNSWPDETAERKAQGFFAQHKGRWYLVNQSGDAMRILDGALIRPGTSLEVTEGLALQLSPDEKAQRIEFHFLNSGSGTHAVK